MNTTLGTYNMNMKHLFYSMEVFNIYKLPNSSFIYKII